MTDDCSDVRSLDPSEYDTEGDGEYNVLQTQIVDKPIQTGNNSRNNDGAHNGTSAEEETDDWSPRTSFTADSPYFDAFCEGEIGSLNMLSETLGDISQKTRAFVRAGALMCEATRQLALACKLSRDVSEEPNSNHSNNGISREEGEVSEEEMQKQRRQAVGEEMANILELLGEVRSLEVAVLVHFYSLSTTFDLVLRSRFLRRLPWLSLPCARR